jgi:DME family drug/metabolite transporter
MGPAQVLAGSPLNPVALGGWRLAVGGLLLGMLTLRGRGTLRALTGKSARWPLLGCVAAVSVNQVVFFYAVSESGAALATVLSLGTTPVAVGACAWWITGERVNAGWLISTGLAVVGCLLVLAPGSGSVGLGGVLPAVLSGICNGAHMVFAKKLSIDNPSINLPAASSLSLLVGALVMSPWMIADADALAIPSSVALIVWLGVATGAIAYWLFFTGLERVSATTAGTLNLAEPFAAAILGVVFLGENLPPIATAGCVLLVGGVVATMLPLGRRPGLVTEDDPERTTVFSKVVLVERPPDFPSVWGNLDVELDTPTVVLPRVSSPAVFFHAKGFGHAGSDDHEPLLQDLRRR